MTAVAFDPPKGDLDAMRKEIVSELKLWTAGGAARRILEQVCLMRRPVLMAAFAATLFLNFFGSARAMDSAKSRAVVSDAFGEMIATFGGKTLDAMAAQTAMTQIIRKYADLRLIAESKFGRFWQDAPNSVKEKFPGLMEHFFVTTFSRLVINLPMDMTVNVVSVEDRGARQVVRTTIGEPGGDQSDVSWLIAESADAHYVICDVSKDGIAVIAAQISDWTSVIHQYGGTLEGLFGPLELITRDNKPSGNDSQDNSHRHQR